MIMYPKTASVLLLALATMLAGAPAQAADRSVVILQSITGVGAFVGAPASEGMKFAAEEINANGFMGNDKLKITVIDDASDRGQATAAISRVAQDSETLVVLGPTIGPNAIAGASVANDVKIPIFTMTLADAVLKAGPWSFIAAQVPEITMPALSNYVADKLKIKTCAYIGISDNEAYVVLGRVFRENAEKKGIKIIENVGVKQGDSDFSAVATKVVAAKPE
jgi:branched-chain amino acid transport system substrate-binding protein